MILVYFVGTAGSGKTFMTKAFEEWILSVADCFIVNLDPGADFVPYPADFDVREYFTLEDVMHKYNVGPNGAQIVCADLIATIIDDLKFEIESSSADFTLIDTPGQMEIFTVRESSKILISALGQERSVMVYLFDPIVSKTPSGFLSQLFLANSAAFRLEIPQINVLSKSDVLSKAELEKILRWSFEPDTLLEDLERKNLTVELFSVLKTSGFFRPLIPVSSKEGKGFEDVYDGIQEFFYGGEDLERVLF